LIIDTDRQTYDVGLTKISDRVISYDNDDNDEINKINKYF